jgi:outer membrane protein OmpA-like peptidoglycan-associated protein
MKVSAVIRSACIFLGILMFVGVGFSQQPDVARRTTAVTYPLDDTVTLQFRGTTRFPRMKGSAKVKRTTRYGTKIELNVDNMPRPFELGAGYATYVVWAISPEGQADNLGEIKRSTLGFIDSKVTVTTSLQTFALIITAEPHFMVTRPSQAIMMENLNPIGQNGKIISTVPSVQYFGNSSDYFRDPRTPEIAEIDYAKTPTAILQATQAVALARYAGAERDASVELAEADTYLRNATAAWQAGRDSDTVDIAARRAIAAAVKAEGLSFERKSAREKRNEKLRNDADIRSAENRFTDAQNEITELKNELARETRNRELAERDVMNYTNQIKDLREENGRVRDELARVKLDLENANAKLQAIDDAKRAADAQRDDDAKAAKAKQDEAALVTSLKQFGTVTKNERGIVLTLPESLFTGPRADTFAARSESKLTSLAALLAANPDYRVAIEAYTDNSGDPDTLQDLTDKRSYALAEKISAAGIPEGRLMAKGFGASSPIAPNTTAASRAKNRRVLLILNYFPK